MDGVGWDKSDEEGIKTESPMDGLKVCLAYDGSSSSSRGCNLTKRSLIHMMLLVTSLKKQ